MVPGVPASLPLHLEGFNVPAVLSVDLMLAGKASALPDSIHSVDSKIRDILREERLDGR